MREHMRQVDRSTLERIAGIIGPASAAAQALASADSHPGPVRFWFNGRSWLVEKLAGARKGEEG